MAPDVARSARPAPKLGEVAAAHSQRFAILFATIVATSLGGLVVALHFPTEAEGFTYATVAQHPRAFWWFLLAAGINLAVGVTALAVAGTSLARKRGVAWATLGGALMWLGAGLYAVGIGNWAGTFVTATNPVLDEAMSRALVDAANTDGLHMWAAPGGGAGLVAVGTVLLAVGLWRARSVPRWVPTVAAVSIIASLLMPTAGLLGLIVEGPIAASSIAIGWYAWRRTHAHDLPELAPARDRRAEVARGVERGTRTGAQKHR
jgi:hypothetical protein